MSESSSLVDRFFFAVRNNPLTATLIIVAVLLTSFVSFTDTFTKLSKILPELHKTTLAGNWRSDALIDANTGLQYRSVFNIKTD